MPMSTVISVHALSKKYLISHQRSVPYLTMRDALGDSIRQVGRKLSRPFRADSGGNDEGDTREEFFALKDVCFEVKQGDRLGIIGRNGAGKSTLLKILSRITEPTTGRVKIRGRVASLLEVGTGFHPELTGRENIFLNGAILGMGKAEIRRKFDAIVDFAGVERFLDTPVKRYSSGMYVRLAFAVAAHLEPEILIVDEVLAVGDAQFQKKCLGKMHEVGAEGRTIIFVSHNMSAVRALCGTGLLLNGGCVDYSGSAADAVEQYSRSLSAGEDDIPTVAYEGDEFVVDRVSVNGKSTRQIGISPDESILTIDVRGTLARDSVVFLECRVFDEYENCLAYFTPRRRSSEPPKLSAGKQSLRIDVQLPDITRGAYYLSLFVVRSELQTETIAQLDRAFTLVFEGAPLANGWAVAYRNGNGFVLLDEACDRKPA